MKLIEGAVKDYFKIHSLSFSYSFKNKSPYNTTDVSGIKHSFSLLTQFVSYLTIQHFFNLQTELKANTGKDFDSAKYIRSTLMSPGREYELDLDYNDHKEFLKYWAEN